MDIHKNILIIEAYTDANIGSGAIVENSIKLLTEELKVPKQNIRVMAHFPEAFVRKYDIIAVKDIFNFPYNRNILKQISWLIYTCNWMLFSWIFYKKAIKCTKWIDFNWADVVISVGAERINDKYIKNELFSLFTYAIVKKFKKKIILFPSTYGPFLYHFTRYFAEKVFMKLDLIYARDSLSYETINSFKGINRSKIIKSSDIAIIQEWDNDQYKNKLFDNDLPIVGISALKWTYVANKYQTPYCNYNSYISEMSELIDRIILQYNANIILYPTNYPINGCRENDVIVAKEIYNLCEKKERILIIQDLPSAQEFKSMIACSEVNIVTRMHACILSTSAYVPTMSINYLFKLKEYMVSIGLSNYTIDIEDFNSTNAFSMFQNLWNSRANERIKLVKQIKSKNDCLKSSINKISEYLVN
jgi:colanic acid/amylovoran biosynthesis protein